MPSNPGLDNGQGNIDIKYSTTIGGMPYQVYLQLMNEDSNPIVHSGTAHVFGASTWVPGCTGYPVSQRSSDQYRPSGGPTGVIASSFK